MFFSPLFRFSSSGTAALEEDAQILKVIEAYCTSAKTRQTLNSSKTTRKLTDTAHVHAQQTRGAHWSSPSLLLLYSVTQCLSLTLVFWSDLSNSIFSFCLSLLHSSPFWHRFLTFFLIFPPHRLFFSSMLLYNFSPMFWFGPSPPPGCFFMISHSLPVLPPPPPPSAPSPFSSHHICVAPSTSLAGHRPDAQPRAGRRGPVLYGLAGPP